ncbi:hypothetical protein [Brachybacterium phenoliresistens]|uniref:Membrane protein n=1 Tax=Brachybacterium phenoliresistens TaxID=396014 RepID=Z9JSS5_9MICO|nr:hypothetical protein [Brachybacterium phenoliresistens]EWS80817.1 membrane protein [Brachybacterium phenoliresistens]
MTTSEPAQGAPGRPGAARPDRPEAPALLGTRRAAAALLALEGLALLGVATFAFAVIARVPEGGRFGTGLGIFVIAFALAVFAAARSILARTRFGVGYGITWQLFQALVGASLLTAGLIPEGFAAIAVAVATFVLLTRIARATPLPHDLAAAAEDRRDGTGPSRPRR